MILLRLLILYFLASFLVGCGGGSSAAIVVTPPSITLTSTHSLITENSGTEVSITATASKTSTENIVVTLATTGTATADSDYTAIADTITIMAGETANSTTGTVTNDSASEENETIIVSISNVTGGSATESGTQSVTVTIVDDESTPSITLTSSVTSLDENSGTTVTLTATSSVAASSDITVTLATTGTATDGTDYSAVDGTTITISAGDTTGTKTFTMTDDSVYEGNESAIIAISGVSGGSAVENGDQSINFRIDENESVPAITLATSASTIDENSSSTVTLTASSSLVASSDITVTLATTGTGTDGTDYSAVNGTTITITAGSTTGTKTFTITDDSVYEDDETVIVAISTVTGSSAQENGDQSVTTTITENESAPTITLATSATSIAENSSTTVTLTATASQIADEDITVTLATTGTGTSGTDYSAVNASTITITAGATTGTKTFTMTDDSVSEGDETAIVAISAVSGGGASESGAQSVTVTITDNDSPSITLTSSVATLAENSSTTVTLTATSSMTSTSDITVTLATAGTATDGTDYSAVNGTTITISAGATTGTKTFTMTNDSSSESDETIITSISGVSGGNASESGTQSVTFTIVDDESTPVITLAISTTSLAENSGTSVTLTATSSVAAASDITVTLATTGTGTDGTDYSVVNGTTITISAGATTGIKTFTMTDDSVYEGNETAVVAISGVSGASAVESGSQSVTFTITENESAPTITLATSSTSLAENSGTTVTLTATTSSTSTLDIVVTLAVTGTGTEGTDYSAIDETITISAGDTSGTKTFTMTDDSVYEGDETVIVAIASVTNASESGTQSVTTTITENESSPTVQISSSAASVYDNGLSLTLTATSTQIADEAITVVIGTSGTSTEGTDYATVSDITIAAGSTTGTATFNPTADTVNEGSETAIISITSVSGADSAKGSTTSVTITINEYALRTGTAFTEGTTAAQNAIVSSAKWWYVDGANAVSTVHPYEQMNIHKVRSFTDGTDTLTGKGEFIHIVDFNCDDNHMVYDNKTIHNLDDGGSGESTFDSATSSAYHCQFVATMAAGDITGSNLASGVAPDADLILSSLPNWGGSFRTDDWGRDLDSARGFGAIASNNSWGNNDKSGYSTCASGDANCGFNATEFQTLIDNYPSYSRAQLLAFVIQNDTSSTSTAALNEYLTALDNFQSSGVIVFSSGNSTYESDVNLMGALPEFFPDLAEAWISVGYVDFTGDSIEDAVESEFSMGGNKCGSAQEYCVVADGTHLYGATYVSGSTHYYADNKSGSSYAAPMISGGLALLGQAFPNHTPEQLTDRLLASANNDWFTAEGSTTFTTHGNSVTHGYHSTWGQGIPDFYAAMSPITSNSNPALALYTGNSIQTSRPISLESSYITPSSSFGNAISQGMIGEIGYAYDALSGGFKYDMSTRVNMTDNKAPTISLSSELSKLDNQLKSGNNSNWKQNFSKVLSTLSKREGLETALTLGASSLPVQSFFGSNLDSSVNLSDFQTPYLESGEGGIGLSANYQLGKSRLLLGATTPVLINTMTGAVAGSRKSLVASLEYGNPSETAFTLMSGITQDEDSLLGSTGNDAYSMSGSRSNTTFAALKVQNQLTNDFTLTGIATTAKTDMSSPTQSYINSANSVKSSSVSLIASQQNITGDDRLSLSISQPNRVNGGDMSIRLSNLAESDGSISYRDSNINLEPTGRQMVYGLSYSKDLSEGIGFSVKHLLTSNLNHNQDSALASSSYVGFKYKDLKLGYNINSQDSSKNSELAYLHKF